MPWKSVKGKSNNWKIVKSDTGEVVGMAASKSDADKRVRAMYANYNK